jgi:cytochrome P450
LVENEREKTENNLSCKDIVDEFSTFFVAGMDTTGHLIGISLYKLIEVYHYFIIN